MARLQHIRDNQIVVLEYEHIVGRSGRCALRRDLPFVSAQHATLRWTGGGWELRDLGSVNGTFLDGEPLTAGVGVPIERGARIVFGGPDEEWELIDDAPPQVMLVSADGKDVLCADGDLLGVPSGDDPQATLYCGQDGRWRLERADSPLLVLADQQDFELNGGRWRFSCPAFVSPTSKRLQSLTIEEVRLNFLVSHDEEDVEIQVVAGTASNTLGRRAHNYVLLTLARRRLEDTAGGLPDTACGWTDQERLVKGLMTTPSLLNIDIFRIRRQFGKTGIQNAVNVIERRPRARQIRIGVRNLSVMRV